MTIKLFRFVPALGVFSTFVLSGCFEQPASGPSAAELEALRKADEAQLAMEETRNAYDWQAAEVERRSLELENQLQAMESELQLRKDAEMQTRLEALREETERLRAEGERARAESERITREVEEIRRATPVVMDRPVERPEWDGLFRERLSPYGNWVSVSGYGDCWDPSVGGRGDWRPYVDGSWGWSDQGWSWVSNEPFGWATYHYGRWVRVARYGWVWVPGMEWAPAWVAWRSGNSHIGWAPLPPEPAGLSWTGVGRDCDSRYRLQAAQYVFVPVTRFVSPSYQNVFVSQAQVTQIYQQSVNVTQIVSLDSNHSGIRGGHGRIFGQTGGPDRHWIDRECRAEVPSIRPRLADGSIVAGQITRLNREGPGPVGPVEVVRSSPEEPVSRDRLRVPSVVGQPLVRPEGAGGDSMVGPRGDFRRDGDRPRESPRVVAGSDVQPQARDLPSIGSGTPETISIDLENGEGRGFRRDRTIPGEARTMGDIGQVRSPTGPSVTRPNEVVGRGADGAPRPDGPRVDRLVAPNQSPDAVGDAPAAVEVEVINPSLMRGRARFPTREELSSRGEGGRLRTDLNAGVEPPGTGPERHVQPELSEVVPTVESAVPEQATTSPMNMQPEAGRGPSRAGRSGSGPNSAVEGTEPNMQQQQAERQKAAEEREARQQQAMAEAQAAQEETARVVAEDQAKQQEAMALQLQAEEAKRMEAEALAQQQAMEAQRIAEAEAARMAAEAEAKQQAMEAGRQAEEAARLAAEEDARRQQAMESQRQAEEEARQQAMAAQQQQAEEAARRAAEEQARQQAMDAQRQAEEQARQQAMEAQRQAEEAARLAAEEQMRQQQAMEAQRQAEEAARLAAEEQMRQQQAMEAQRQAEEAARRAAEEQMRQQQAMEAQRQAEEAARRAAEEQMRRQAEEAQRQAQEAARRAAEEQMRRQAEEAQRQAQEAAQRAAQEAAQRAAEEAARQQGAGGQ